MITLSTLFVSSDRVALRWAVDPAPDSGVVFTVWRSGNAVNGFEQVGSTKSIAHVDRLARFSKFQPAYYQVYATIAGHVVKSNVAALEAVPDPHAQILAKRERFRLAKYDGVPAFVFSRRAPGTDPACPRCTIDPIRGEAGIRCEVCYGTGIQGGFYAAIPIYLAAQALKTEGADLHEEHVVEASSRNMWTSNWTLIRPEDVIIEMVPPNHVWWVTGMQRSERLRAPLRQIMTVKETDLGGPLGNLPIPAITFPDRADMFYFDPVTHRDFDVVFGEVLDAASRPIQIPGISNEPALEPVRPVYGPGTRDPETGIYS